MRAVFSDFWLWWTNALTLKHGAKTPTHKGKSLVLSSKGFRYCALSEVNGDAERQDFDVLQHTSAKELAKINKAVLSNDMFVHRHLTSVFLPASDALKMAELDLDTSTPFKKHDVYLNVDVSKPHIANGSCYQIIRKDILDDALRNLNSFGVKLESLIFSIGEREVEVPLAKLKNVKSPLSRWLLPTFISICLIALIGTYLHQIERYDTALGVVGTQADTLNAKAKKVRLLIDERKKVIDNLDAVRASQNGSSSVTLLWSELTKALPDSAYLTDLKITNGELTIAGFAKSAASLLPALEASERLNQVEFKGPVVNVPGQTGQRFTLSMRVKQ